jgi:flagellar hook-length control protein FliK
MPYGKEVRVVIQISPQTEPVYADASQLIKQEHEAEVQQKPDAPKGELGVFAKILAGLKGKTTNHNPTDEALLAKAGIGKEDIEGEISNKSEKLAGSSKIAKGKGIFALKTNETAETEAIQVKKNGETELEIPLADISGHENNVFYAVSRLTGQDNEQANEKDTLTSDAVSAHLSGRKQKAEKTDAAAIQMPAKPVDNEKQSQLASAVTTNELTENPKDDNKKSRARQNSGDAIIRSDFTAAKSKAEEIQGAEVKKVALGEKEPRNRFEEARNKRKAFSFDIRDYRNGSQAELVQRDGAIQFRTGVETRFPSESSREITLELRLPNQGQESSSAATSWESKASQALENMLARELHQNFNNDIVRHASIALRDGNEGTIRLALKPESLGNVKIHLEMAENKIIGHIVVESEEALRAFEREISSLEKAFKDSGFESANLQMSLAADGGAEQQWQEMEASHFLPGQVAASRYDAAAEMAAPMTLDIYQGAGLINVLA